MIGEKIKLLRTCLKLTQQEFADRLKIKRNTLASYEVGKSSPSDSAVNLICREFSVNEYWLRNGEGEMFVEKTKDQQIEDMVNEIMVEKPEDFRRRFVRALAALDADGWAALERFIDSISETTKKEEQAVTVPQNSNDLTPEEQEVVRQLREKKNRKDA